MEEQLNPLAVTHLLQYTLRSLCSQQDNNNNNSQWVYAVFWRILPRNYPPPKWDSHGGAYDRSRGNRRNWILVWEDGFCNFGAASSSSSSSSTANHEMNSSGVGEYNKNSPSASSANYGAPNCTEFQQHFQQQTPAAAAAGLQPELFFKMSHEIYNYGEGLIGKVAADHSHKWIYKEPNNDQNQEINFLSAWHNSADAQPRTWEAQFQSGIKTIALIAVREGVVQLGGVQKVMEDLSYVVLLRKKFAYIESIPGVLLPHPSSAAFPAACRPGDSFGPMPDMWTYNGHGPSPMEMGQAAQLLDHYGGYNHQQAAQQQAMVMRMNMITPSMSSLEALLSKLPSVGPGHGPGPDGFCGSEAHQFVHHLGNNNPPSGRAALELMGTSQRVAKEEVDNNNNDQENNNNHNHVISGNNNNSNNHEGEISSSISSYNHHFPYNNHHHHDLNLAVTRPGTGF